jgi:phospholipid transport system substrate-binding protein
MMAMRVFILIVLLGLNAADGFAEVKAPVRDPEKVVGDFHVILLSVMKQAKSLNAKERYKKLEPAITKAFNLGFMIQVAAGSAWRKASDEHKGQLRDAFRHMSIATYAFRFKGYSGQRFETLKTGDGPRKLKLIYTRIVTPKKDKRDDSVALTYVTKKFKTGWKIVDVLLGGGISELAVKRSEYRSTLKTKGAGVLAILLNKKADQLIAK